MPKRRTPPRLRSLVNALTWPRRRSRRRKATALPKTVLPKTVLRKAVLPKAVPRKAAPAKAAALKTAPAKAAPAKAARAKAPATVRRGSGSWHQQNHHGPAGPRPYSVYVPARLPRRSPVPLAILLHGCRQTPVEFAAATRFNDLADRHGFVVAYPDQGWHHRHRCWHWYEAGHQERGTGEPAILAELTRELLAERVRWRADPERVYLAGLSAGGAMALVLAATYPELYAAVGVHSAPAYRSATNGSRALGAMAGHTPIPEPPGAGDGTRAMPPTIVFQGTDDRTVSVRNGQRVTDQWLAYHRAHTPGPNHPDRVVRSSTAAGRSAGGHPYTTSRWYTARGRKVLEYWQVDGLGHAWSGGTRGGSFADPRGPRASTAMWRFFALKRRAGSGAPPAQRS